MSVPAPDWPKLLAEPRGGDGLLHLQAVIQDLDSASRVESQFSGGRPARRTGVIIATDFLGLVHLN